MLKNVADPGAFRQAAQEAAPFAVAATVFDQGGEEGGQALDKAGQGIRRVILEFANVDDGFNDWAVGPQIRAPQMAYFKELDVFWVHGFAECG